MKGSFVFSIVAFTLGFVTHGFVSRSANDLNASNAEIMKEATETLAKTAPEALPPDTRANLNPRALAPAPITNANVPQRAPASVGSSTGGNSAPPPKSNEGAGNSSDDFVTTLSTGEEMWCRSTTPNLDTVGAVCRYESSCFACSKSRLIVPEVTTAVPICSNGVPAEEKTAICCAHSGGADTLTCPDFRSCFESTEPTDHCKK